MSKIDLVAIGALVRSLRNERNLSAAELALKAGVHANTIWLLESGRARNTTVRSFDSIAEALGISTTDLLCVGPHRRESTHRRGRRRRTRTVPPEVTK